MGVKLQMRGSDRVVEVEGDLSCPATLVSLHSTLTSLAFTDVAPVVVDLSTAHGESAEIDRLLDRVAILMRSRGVPYSQLRADARIRA